MRAIDIDYFVKEWMPEHLEWDFYDMDVMYHDEQWQAELPIIEAEPIRHGHWEYDEISGNNQCSVCFSSNERISGYCNSNEFEYCPWCGAKMDEDKI